MYKPNKALRRIFFSLIRLLLILLLGMTVRRRHLLPEKGPAIVVANHNSHLDTLMLISLFHLKRLPHIRPIAAADYFMKTKPLAWFATRIIGIIPLERGAASRSYDPLQPCCDALDRGDVIILFPEGSRGEPEKLSQFKKGIAHLAERYPDVPITPVFIHGLGKALPKDDFVLVPFFCDIFVGEPLRYKTGKLEFMETLAASFRALADEGHFKPWD